MSAGCSFNVAISITECCFARSRPPKPALAGIGLVDRERHYAQCVLMRSYLENASESQGCHRPPSIPFSGAGRCRQRKYQGRLGASCRKLGVIAPLVRAA
ncbi:hypothetical protein GbCGDNIH6_8252 [Granulibacter bethesdensis]|nr:hypothetical protein GbCGDNIH6_8252 [Granulibacter bethesdensis]